MTDNKRSTDVSDNALGLARSADRALRGPGTYVITVQVDTHRKRPWSVSISRVERIVVGSRQ